MIGKLGLNFEPQYRTMWCKEDTDSVILNVIDSGSALKRSGSLDAPMQLQSNERRLASKVEVLSPTFKSQGIEIYNHQLSKSASVF